MVRFEVLNPVADLPEKKGEFAPRLTDLKGKTIGLFWNIKPGGDAILHCTAQLLSERYENIHFKDYVGSAGALIRRATIGDFDRMVAECDAVMGASCD